MLGNEWLLIAALGLVGCGARGPLEAESTGTTTSAASSTSSVSSSSASSSSGGTAHLALMRPDCGPTDGPAVSLWIDGTTCAAEPDPGITVLVSEVDALASGATLTIVSGPVGGPSLGTQAERHDVGDTIAADGGTITFSSYTEGQGAAGSYDISFADGSTAQGTFTATWCAFQPTCG